MDRGYSLRDLARKAGYSPGYIADIESGRRLPRSFVLHCILKVLSVEDRNAEVLELYCNVKERCLIENLAKFYREMAIGSFASHHLSHLKHSDAIKSLP
jgi:transcriptional regulator with XRE-family HTH domain